VGKESDGNLDSLKRLYTVVLKGGDPFEVAIPFSGAVEHDGVHSLHHIYCTKDVLDSVLSLGATQCKVYYDSESEEQRAERATLHRQDLDKVFPTSECGGCYWFDLHTENMCGAMDWSDDIKKASLELHQEALEGLNRCPISVAVAAGKGHPPKG
tara:strand:- start:29 stop:493 length:465 start_codon:yes stop_codon:yes gene_type:complete